MHTQRPPIADPTGWPERGDAPWAVAARWFAAHTFAPTGLPERWRHPLLGYLAAVLLEGAAVVVVVLLADIFDGFAFPALLSLLMVALVALTWGLGPSLLATLLGGVLLGWLLRTNLLHLYEHTTGRVVALALFLGAAACLSILASRVERARRGADVLTRLAEQTRQEAQLQAQRLDAAFEAIADGVYVCDTEARLLRTNAAYRSLFGFDAQPSQLDRSLAERIAWGHPRDPTGAPLSPEDWPVARVLRGETLTGARTVDLRANALNGEEREVDVSGAPVRDANGAVVGGVLAMRDVTERRRLERRTREALQALLTMAETLVAAPRTDPHEAGLDEQQGALPVAGRLAEVARRVLAARRVGIIALEEAGPQPVAVAGATPDDEREWWAGVEEFAPRARPDSSWSARLRAGEVVEIDLTRPPFHRRATIDATTVLVAPLRLDDGLIGVLTVDVDGDRAPITTEERALALAVAQFAAVVLERARLHGARAEAARLAELDRLRGEFVATVSHELQTPLTAVRAGLGLLEAGLGSALGLAEAELLAATRRNVERLRLRIDDLLVANRLEAGAMRPAFAPLDLRQVVAPALAAVQPLLQEKTQHATLDLPVPLPIRGDGALLEQVMVNLLANANRHTPSGTPITVSGYVIAGEVRLMVRDTGPGVPPADLETVFEPFQRLGTAAGRHVPGAGLGLSIARRIVDLHAGRLWAENGGGGELGADADKETGQTGNGERGAVFIIALPRDQATTGAPP